MYYKNYGKTGNPTKIGLLFGNCVASIHREFPAGKGFSYIVLIPRRYIAKPAIVVELKYNKKVDAAIAQIKQKQYPDALKDYTGDILPVGITYDKATKRHQCRMEHLR